MKKFKYIILFFLTIFVSGCVKYESTIDIKLNKSMIFSMSMAFDQSLISMMEKDPFENLDVSEAEKNGFQISRFEEENRKGIKIKKKVKNIDQVSSVDEKVFDLSNLANSEENFIFKIKKGLLKNIYTVKIKFEKNGIMDEFSDTDIDIDNSFLENLDYENILSSMDLKFNVHLPFSAISHNATHALNHNKDLVWDLMKLNNESIDFEFSLYNWVPLLVIIFGLLFLIVLIVLFKNHRKSKENKENKGLEPLQSLNITPISMSEDNLQAVTEKSIIQPTINNSVQPSVSVPSNENRVLNQTFFDSSNLQNFVDSKVISSFDNQLNNENGTKVNDDFDCSQINTTNAESFPTGLDATENNLFQSPLVNSTVQSLDARIANNLNDSNENPVSLTNEKNLDTVNGQIMQDLKVEDVFNVTQIQEIENGQIKNPNDNGV